MANVQVGSFALELRLECGLMESFALEFFCAKHLQPTSVLRSRILLCNAPAIDQRASLLEATLNAA
jgi:hypothetical protein